MAPDKNNSTESLPAWKWTGAETLEFVYSLNERCLQELGNQAGGHRRSILEGKVLEPVTSRPELWVQLDGAALRRAARCPFLLVGVKFDDLKWWLELQDSPAVQPSDSDSLIPFPVPFARELCAEALTLVWHMARSDPRAASLVLGLSPGVAGIIAAVGPRQIQRIAAEHAHQLRPRWQNSPEFWQELLLTAISGNKESLTEFHLQSLQLLGTDLLRAV